MLVDIWEGGTAVSVKANALRRLPSVSFVKCLALPTQLPTRVRPLPSPESAPRLNR
ncbi:MAG: hypothetical protein H6667_20365 [Ardenticatenaceae bacterium]|nr:hypothetical protein [Ardenticatenaceae bacterium]